MFYSNTELSRDIRHNIFTFAILSQYLNNESISNFTCHVNLQKKDGEPYRVFVDYVIQYTIFNDDDYPEETFVDNRFFCDYGKFMEAFDKDPEEYDLVKRILRENLLDEIYHCRIGRDTRLFDIPRELLDPETNVLDCIDAYNTKIDNLHKHLMELFEKDSDDLKGFNAVDLKTLEMLPKNWCFDLGEVQLNGKKFEYILEDIYQPFSEFICTFDEFEKDNRPDMEDGIVGMTSYAKLGD